MRVQYTLPGFLPAETLPSEAAEPTGGPFVSRLKFLPAPRALNWKSLLHLDEDPLTLTSLDPPPRSAASDFRDAASERWNWAQMLDRLVATSGDGPDEFGVANADDKAIQQMLTMLLNLQEAEDSIAARYLAEPEG